MTPRHTLYVAAVALLALGLAGMVGRGQETPEIASQRPIVVSVPFSHLTSEPLRPTLRSMSYSEWRESTPRGIVTEDEVWVALVEAGVPPASASVLARASVNCEAPVRDRDGTSIGARLTAVGDSGRSSGPLQVNEDYNPWAASLYLFDLSGSSEATARIEREGGVSRWSCAR